MRMKQDILSVGFAVGIPVGESAIYFCKRGQENFYVETTGYMDYECKINSTYRNC